MKSRIKIENENRNCKYPHLTRFKMKNEDENSNSKFIFRCSICGAEYRFSELWNPIGTELGYCMKCKTIWEEIKNEK